MRKAIWAALVGIGIMSGGCAQAQDAGSFGGTAGVAAEQGTMAAPGMDGGGFEPAAPAPIASMARPTGEVGPHAPGVHAGEAMAEYTGPLDPAYHRRPAIRWIPRRRG